MNEATIRSLNAINRRFYDERADEFDQTRERAWRGWDDLVERYGTRVRRNPKVLDVGCGNGRFARFLRNKLDGPFDYVGIDASALGLEHAARRLDSITNVRLYQHDFVIENEPIPEELASEAFDWVVLFGVVHHIPGRDHRAKRLRQIASLVAPAGVMAYTIWRFDRFERFRKKLVPFQGLDIDESELEPGDRIVTWGDEAPGHRYCHAMSDDEAEALERSLPLTPLPSFKGDNDLNDYYVLVNT